MLLSDAGQSRKRWQAFMDAAAARLQDASHQDGSEAGNCARQLMLAPSVWRTWEAEFATSARSITRLRDRSVQLHSLRKAGVSWVHQAAPFRYVRDERIRGEARRRVMLGLRNQSSYTRAMVAEHGVYLRSVCHILCSAHAGHTLLGDALFESAMQRYQAIYMEYFGYYCAVTFSAAGVDTTTPRELLPMLKSQVSELRQAILDYPLRSGWLRRESILRQPSGDTVRLPRLPG
jgi:hypothetical protein